MIGLLSDAHGNLKGFRKGLEILRARGVENLFFLGDSVGYIANFEVLDYLQESSSEITCLLGNHETMLLRGDVSGDYKGYSLGKLRADLGSLREEFIRSWSSSMTFTANSKKIRLCHGTLSDPIFGYLYANETPSSDYFEFDAVFHGNTHRAFSRMHEGTLVTNVGSCGLPRDNATYGSVALYDPSSNSTEILRYDLRDAYDSILCSDGLHQSVRDLIRYRRENFEGTIVD